MKLDDEVNYIASGLERSGTSMLMQILYAGEVPIAFDDTMRPPDESNPRGYFELAGGKIINKLMDGTFHLEKYTGLFIKITAYGLEFLPPGKYKIIYSERNLEEILDSMEKMAAVKDAKRAETREAFDKLNQMTKKKIMSREDMQVLFINYNEIIADPHQHIAAIAEFLGASDDELQKMIGAVDKKLYRQRRIP